MLHAYIPSCHDVAMQSLDITNVLIDPLLKFTQE